jgi:hypothetical protein
MLLLLLTITSLCSSSAFTLFGLGAHSFGLEFTPSSSVDLPSVEAAVTSTLSSNGTAYFTVDVRYVSVLALPLTFASIANDTGALLPVFVSGAAPVSQPQLSGLPPGLDVNQLVVTTTSASSTSFPFFSAAQDAMQVNLSAALWTLFLGNATSGADLSFLPNASFTVGNLPGSGSGVLTVGNASSLVAVSIRSWDSQALSEAFLGLGAAIADGSLLASLANVTNITYVSVLQNPAAPIPTTVWLPTASNDSAGLQASLNAHAASSEALSGTNTTFTVAQANSIAFSVNTVSTLAPADSQAAIVVGVATSFGVLPAEVVAKPIDGGFIVVVDLLQPAGGTALSGSMSNDTALIASSSEWSYQPALNASDYQNHDPKVNWWIGPTNDASLANASNASAALDVSVDIVNAALASGNISTVVLDSLLAAGSGANATSANVTLPTVVVGTQTSVTITTVAVLSPPSPPSPPSPEPAFPPPLGATATDAIPQAAPVTNAPLSSPVLSPPPLPTPPPLLPTPPPPTTNNQGVLSAILLVSKASGSPVDTRSAMLDDQVNRAAALSSPAPPSPPVPVMMPRPPPSAIPPLQSSPHLLPPTPALGVVLPPPASQHSGGAASRLTGALLLLALGTLAAALA